MLLDQTHIKLNQPPFVRLSKGLIIIPLVLMFVMPNVDSLQAQKVNRIAAIVNDKVISTFDLQERIRLIMFSAGLLDNDSQKSSLEPQVLRDLIDETLQAEEAERLNIRITNKEMSNALSRIERSNNIPQGSFENMMNP